MARPLTSSDSARPASVADVSAADAVRYQKDDVCDDRLTIYYRGRCNRWGSTDISLESV